ncbi:molybdopterin molybdotransferase MoeA [Edaphobacter bradus]|uniref:molybdopterin molybdotransferase MoeA n=1 Tax=Edaphobacter bradus TaxID=2259016 RepID=UPI0021E037B1|nr:gephyrin-like molybdotransferase Glp [Edaphobacter bradus]
MNQVLEFDEALAVVLREATALRHSDAVERHPLLECLGRVLAEPVVADRDQPGFDRSTRDGFAVRAADASAGRAMRVQGLVRAGEQWEGLLEAGAAIEIMTGAPLPKGADAVLMVEHVERGDGSIRLAEGRGICAGENIVPKGSEAQAGDVLLPVGTELGAAEIALAAACGWAEPKVFARPKVAIVATGDELVEIGQAPAAHQIRNSNSYGIAALVTQAGGWPGRLQVARDRREELWERVAQGRMWDLLVFSGGVSMGKYDLVDEVLAESGAEFFFTGVKMQPGKPVVFGRLPERDGVRECYFFGLPGNPVSTQVTFQCFVGPMVRALAGAAVEGPRFVQATLGEDVAGKAGLTRLLPARLTGHRVRPEVKLVGWQGSGDLAANARANCYAVLPAEGRNLGKGEMISVLLQ